MTEIVEVSKYTTKIIGKASKSKFKFWEYDLFSK